MEQWIDKELDEEDIEKIKVENNTIIVQKKKTYILASWKQGDGNYTFSVEVK